MTIETQPFVHPHSIVRAIWGRPDVILLIFAGAAAEFALNCAVDWLFFTGALRPNDCLRATAAELLQWQADRQFQLHQDLANSRFTAELYERYSQVLGWLR